MTNMTKARRLATLDGCPTIQQAVDPFELRSTCQDNRFGIVWNFLENISLAWQGKVLLRAFP